jgi:hypothetical protein
MASAHEPRRGHLGRGTAEAVRAFRDALDALVTVRPVPGVDHAASIMSMTGARATADLIAEALGEKALS